MRRQRVLVVDDNAVQLCLFREIIERHVPDCEFVGAEGAAEALRIAMAGPVDCAIIDLIMPGIDGIELCRRLKADAASAAFPVLLVTSGEVRSEHRVAGLEAGADDLLPRPADPEEMAARVRVMLRVKRAEDELRHANRRLQEIAGARQQEALATDARYRHLFETSNDCILVAEIGADGLPGRLLEANPALCRLLGYTREHLLSLRLDALVPADRAGVIAPRTESIREAGQLYYETVLYTAARRSVPMGVNALWVEAGKHASIIMVGHRLRAAGEAGEAEPGGVSLRDFVTQTGQMFYDFDIAAGRASWGGATVMVLGYGRDELNRFSVADWRRSLHPGDRLRAQRAFAAAMREAGQYQIPYRARAADGEYRHLEDTGVVLVDAAARPLRLVGTIKDITLRVQAEEERRRIEQGMQHAQRLESLGVLAGGIAHDFNNILSAIIGLTDLSLQALPKDGEVYADLSEVLQAAHRAKDLVKQILAFSRQAGEERAPMAPHIVAHEVLKLLRASLPPKIALVDRVDAASGMVLGNAGQVHQVIMNFCTNGLHAMRGAGGRLEVAVQDVEVDAAGSAPHPRLLPGPYVRVSVRDTGHGMSEAVAKRIFDPFFTTKPPGEGTGMGLAVVDGIVGSHGGVVTFESAPGRGSVFRMWLPRIVAEASRPSNPGGAAPHGHERILLVDDDEIVLRFGEASLARHGYAVTICTSGEQALEVFAAAPAAFDLVITDQLMPGMTGLELAKALRHARAGMPILLFTGYGTDVDSPEYKESGVDALLEKPVKAGELAHCVRRLLDAGNFPESYCPLP